ncbi:MAG: phosphoribosylanthranilate isomerase [Sphingomonadaceae bacterium]|nr:phosphoribosylanthranilate isomerase [Sphingomonadaceae bacterium]
MSARPLIKICGISTPETLEACIASRADYVGLMFYPPSPRFLAADLAARIAAQAGRRIGKVGVFVDPSDEVLRDAIAAGQLDALQLHRVSAARRAEVKVRFGLPVWAVLELAEARDLAALAHFDCFDRLIYDAKTPMNALPGGMGLTFDWTMLNGAPHPGPWGLAGGLNPGNVAEALRITGAPLLDASSGLETAPGSKDPALIAAFCAAAFAA